MNTPHESSSPAASRVILSLKAGVQRQARPSKAPPQVRPQTKASLQPGARWSDEYRDRMQADMNALTSR